MSLRERREDAFEVSVVPQQALQGACTPAHKASPARATNSVSLASSAQAGKSWLGLRDHKPHTAIVCDLGRLTLGATLLQFPNSLRGLFVDIGYAAAAGLQFVVGFSGPTHLPLLSLAQVSITDCCGFMHFTIDSIRLACQSPCMSKPKKSTHGGKRKKAGRKPVDPALKAVTIAISLTPVRLAKLDVKAVKHGGRSGAVSALIDESK